MADQKISELGAAGALDGSELVEVVKAGVNVQSTTQNIADLNSGITRELNRTFAEELVFDKNEIEYMPKMMDDDINFTVSSEGLINQFCVLRSQIIADGTHSINLTSDFNFIYGITNGQILEAGTYQIYFLYSNGSVTVSVPGITAEQSGLLQLSTPGNFAAVADGESEIDLSWDDVSNESSYLIEFSLDGITGWTTLSAPASGQTTANQTGLSSGVTRYYRIKAVGDGTTYSDSAYSTASATTESGSDLDAPEFTFLPASGNTVWPVNSPIILTADEAIRNTDGSEITNANVANRITLKQTNSGGANIAFTATIDGAKQIITITPTPQYGENQLVYVAINNVEDVNGNEVTVAISSTFTTTDYTLFNGTSNRLRFGDILDSVFAAADTNFWLEITLNNATLAGTRRLITKNDSTGNQRAFALYYINSDVYFAWYRLGTASGIIVIKWAGALTTGEHELVMKYDGSIDTNGGLDRCILEVDGVVQSKVLDQGDPLLLANINNSTAQLAIGMDINSAGTPVGSVWYSGEAKDFIVRSTAGSVVEINVPNLATGVDTSGNGRNGTFV